ncbi:MAG: response regulator transcription factor [Deltaproteobacteria bacterium]|nr:response regulator transcription factor [Deltaproteobacteria bacterium]
MNEKLLFSPFDLNESISVAVIDAVACVRKGLVALISGYRQFSVVGDAGDGEGAVELVAATRPDVVLMDMYLPNKEGGISAVKRIISDAPTVKVLGLSCFSAPDDVGLFMHAGASGFVSKNQEVDEILKAIVILAHGGRYFSADAAANQTGAANSNAFYSLTHREREVFHALVQGLGTGEISSKHHISLDTVATHRRNIFKKIGVDSVPRLIWFAIEHGIINQPAGMRNTSKISV